MNYEDVQSVFLTNFDTVKDQERIRYWIGQTLSMALCAVETSSNIEEAKDKITALHAQTQIQKS